jgi:hypothetical protein
MILGGANSRELVVQLPLSWTPNPILERSVDGLEKRVCVEIEMIRADPHSVEVLHPAIGGPERRPCRGKP